MTDPQVARCKKGKQDQERPNEVSIGHHSFADQTNDELVVDQTTRGEPDEEEEEEVENEYQSLIRDVNGSRPALASNKHRHNQDSQMIASPLTNPVDKKMANGGLLQRIKALINYHDQVQVITTRVAAPNDNISTGDDFVGPVEGGVADAADDWWLDRWPHSWATGEQTSAGNRQQTTTNESHKNNYFNNSYYNELSRSSATTHHWSNHSRDDDDDDDDDKNRRRNNNYRKLPILKEKNDPQHRSIYPVVAGGRRSLQSLLILLLLLIGTTTILVKLLNLLVRDDNNRHSPFQHTSTDHDDELVDESHRRQYELEQSARWLVSTPKCHIPALEPWHKSIEDYVWSKEPMNCSNVIEKYLNESSSSAESDDRWSIAPTTTTTTLTFVQSNKLYFHEEAVRRFAIFHRGPTNLYQCCYKNITRSNANDDDLEYGDVCAPIKSNGISIQTPLIRVYCNGVSLNYTNVHSFNVHDNDEEVALRKVANNKLNSDNYYNVLMLGMDTISRLNGQRQLNRTLKVLSELYETLDFVGYNKVGENTFPNLIPLLTGLKPEQLTQVQCWQPTNYTQDSDKGDDYLDNCKYLWNYYQQLGYKTYFSEDWPGASTFNYLKPGFKHEPTTYYGRPFTLARRALLYPKFKSIGCAKCHLDQPIVRVDLNNLRLFLEDHQSVPYFAFHWSNCPQHDDLNGASQVDHLVAQFFQQIHNITQMDRTFVIFFSDHGYRWNNFVSTRIGHYESSLPMLTIAAPRRFIRQHPELYERLKQHTTALLTPFDIFKTLIDVKNLGLKTTNTSSSSSSTTTSATTTTKTPSIVSIPATPNNNTSKNRRHALITKTTVKPTRDSADPATTESYPTASTKIQQITIKDGLTFEQDFKVLSLLDRHNSSELDRSCIEAGIPDNYCVCHQFETVPTTTSDVLGAAYYLVYVHLHDRLVDHASICHLLDLDKVHKAQLYNMEPLKEKKIAKKKKTKSRRRRASKMATGVEAASTTTASPVVETVGQNKHNNLPNREYNIRFSTKPGGGLFQEVVRYYGDDMARCQSEIDQTKKVVDNYWSSLDDKRQSVISMNSVCEFSVHSESISRLNLYGDQSKCVKSNIELKKICYCKS